MSYRKFQDYIIKRMAKDVADVFLTSGVLEDVQGDKVAEIVEEVIQEYERQVEELEKKARALVDAQIKNFPDADYSRALQLALRKLSEKEGLPL